MLLRQTAFYMAANIVTAVIGFASVMMLTRLVAPGDYGVFVVTVGIASICSTSTFTWLRQSILRFQSVPGGDVRMAALAGYALTLLTYPFAFAAMVVLLGVPVGKAAAALVLAAALALFDLGQEILRAGQRVRIYTGASMARSVLSFGLCLGAVYAGGGGLLLALAVAAGYVLVSVLFARQTWGQPRAPFDWNRLRELAAYGLPISLAGLFVAATLVLDRLALAFLVGTDAAGIYGAAADFVRQVAIVPAVAASLAIAPLAVSGAGRSSDIDVRNNLARGLELLLVVMLPAATGLAILAPDIAAVMLGPAYREGAAQIIPICVFAFVAHTLSQQYVQLSFALAKRPKYFIWHTGAIVAINGFLMVPMIRAFGLPGAALSFLISEVAGVALGSLLARRCYPMPFDAARIARIVAATAFMGALVLFARHLLRPFNGFDVFVIVAVGAVAYAAAGYALDIMEMRRLVPRLLALPALWLKRAPA